MLDILDSPTAGGACSTDSGSHRHHIENLPGFAFVMTVLESAIQYVSHEVVLDFRC